MFPAVCSVPSRAKSQLCVAVNNLHAALAVEHIHIARARSASTRPRVSSPCASIFPHTPRVMRGIFRICVIMMIASVNALHVVRLLPSLRRAPAVHMSDDEPKSEGLKDATFVRKQQAKARRAINTEGVGGVRPSRGLNGFAQKAKRTERKKASAGSGFGSKEGLKYDRRAKPNAPCKCGSGKVYSECCAPLHDGLALAGTPEELVRARYSAYASRLPDFLMTTTDPEGEEWDADADKWKKSLISFCDDFEFQGLEVGDAKAGTGFRKVVDGGEEGEKTPCELAEVSFSVNFAQKGTLKLMVLKETSTFRKTDEGAWLYAKGDVDYGMQE